MVLDSRIFDLPQFQLAALKKTLAPAEVDALKARHKEQWEQWKALARRLAATLALPAPYVESWTNGWQLRAHFFATLKTAAGADSASIISLLWNRRRLTVSLDWHAYRADRSRSTLADYNRWLDALGPEFADWEIWPGTADEYADYPTLATAPPPVIDADHPFYCLGRHRPRAALAQPDLEDWLAASVRALLPLYTASLGPSSP